MARDSTPGILLVGAIGHFLYDVAARSNSLGDITFPTLCRISLAVDGRSQLECGVSGWWKREALGAPGGAAAKAISLGRFCARRLTIGADIGGGCLPLSHQAFFALGNPHFGRLRSL